MIGFLRGIVIHKRPPHLLLEVGGVGYELEAPMTTFYALPDPPDQTQTEIFVHLVVREDAHLLFGFSDHLQRDLFRALLRINGIGPRVALAILSTLTAAQFIACIRQADLATLTKVPGIGKKTAQRMLLDIRDRITELGATAGIAPTSDADPADPTDPTAPPHSQAANPLQDAITALIKLGYKPTDAETAIRAAHDQIQAKSATPAPPRSEDLIRAALKQISAT